MAEADLIPATPQPRTRRSLAGDLRALGLPVGAVVLVHSSLSAAARALLDVIGADGTLVVPTQSGDLSDPAGRQPSQTSYAAGRAHDAAATRTCPSPLWAGRPRRS
jgi:aminoglycoside N3'-acetyltransferase